MISRGREKHHINRMLMAAGLGTLESSGVVYQLAQMVVDHDHFRQILTACEPELRYEMYEAMRPHLKFGPKPLDIYLAEAGAIAECMQLPTWNNDEGKLEAFKSPVIESPEGQVVELVTTTLEEITAKGYLNLVCRKCTKEASFPGVHMAEAIQKARRAGWTYDELKGDGREICPDCP